MKESIVEEEATRSKGGRGMLGTREVSVLPYCVCVCVLLMQPREVQVCRVNVVNYENERERKGRQSCMRSRYYVKPKEKAIEEPIMNIFYEQILILKSTLV